MAYLASKAYIHRDLSARNILLVTKYEAKISGFGLSVRLPKGGSIHDEAEEGAYFSEGGRWPVRWMAPESLLFGKFNHASDVWSYGILLWEIYTLGQEVHASKEQFCVAFIQYSVTT